MAKTTVVEEESCPVCKSTKYLNPKMRLLVSPCYHKMCETCINRLFLHGSAPCPLCGSILRKGNFVVPTFEDLRVEKECRIRKIVAKTFFKRLEDFESVRAYDDYLEEVEDIVFNLVNDVDVQSTYAKLEAFKTENREVIERNLALQANEMRETQREQEEDERRKDAQRLKALEDLEKEEREVKEAKRKLIDELATSNAPAAIIVAENQKRLKAKESSNVRFLKTSSTRLSRGSDTADALTKLPSLRGLKLKSEKNLPTLTGTAFDPFQNLHELESALLLPDLASVPDDPILIGWLECFRPVGGKKTPEEDLVRRQLAAGGCSMESIKKHCLMAAFSWGL